MKIGVCASADRAGLLREVGYDYIELAFNQLSNMEEERFHLQFDLLQQAGIAAESYNCFFPGDIQLYAPDTNQDDLLRRVKEYAEKGFARAAKLGGKISVIGSGWVRKIPDGMPKEAVDQQFARVLSVCGDVAERYGMKVAVEPLARNECNYIHTVEEGATLAKLSGHPSAGVIVDFYHHAKNEDNLAALPLYAGYLFHAHLARPGDRKPPTEEDAQLLGAYAKMLTYCPKVERISLECGWGKEFEAELRRARPVMEIFKSV